MKLNMKKDVCMFPNKKRKNYIKKISNINSCDKITFCLLFPVYTVIIFEQLRLLMGDIISAITIIA